MSDAVMNPFTEPWPRIYVQPTWKTSDSADAEHHDQEAELSGFLGGAEWAAVSPEGTDWDFRIYDRWLYEDAVILAEGTVPSEAWAKLAVQAWVRSHYPVHTSEHTRYVWQHRTVS